MNVLQKIYLKAILVQSAIAKSFEVLYNEILEDFEANRGSVR
jgi:hypothetical protein